MTIRRCEMHDHLVVKTLARMLAATGLTLALVGCSTTTSTSPPSTEAPRSPVAAATVAATEAPAETTSSTPAASPSAAEPAFPRNPAPIVEGSSYVQTIDPADFVGGINNPFLPWVA